jgi:gliding motility-associated-like protein
MKPGIHSCPRDIRTAIRCTRALYNSSMRQRVLCLLVLVLPVFSFSQVTTINLDLSGKKDTTVVIDDVSRNGNVCSGSNCIKFNITLNGSSDLLSLNVQSPAPPGSSAFYQVNCGPQTSLATPVCISGLTTVSVTFCKPGNDKPTYTISASSLVKGSADITLRQNCSGTMSVTGLSAASVNWTSIYPGSAGQYNSYLSCTSGCTSTTVTPQMGSPAYIDYRVSGSTSCAGVRADTIRVYTTPALAVNVTPANPAICSGASTTLTATPSGGNMPYSYAWSSGQSTASITTSATGNYTVSVSDNTNGCAPVSVPVTVSAAATPAAPTVSGATICAGSTATLTPSAPGGTYRWYDAPSGGNLLATGNSFTTPVLNTSTTYYVETTVSSCSSSRTAVTVTINPIPSNPNASGATICAGTSTSLTATAPGGVYEWYDNASGGSLLFTGNSYTTASLNNTTTYYVQSTISGCTSGRTAVAVTVNPIPTAPTAAPATVCLNTSASLQATAPGGIYQWYDAASGGSLLATGMGYTTPALSSAASYYVQTTVSGCTSSRTAVSVSITSSPATPTAASAAICIGSSATLKATAPGGPYEWYGQPSGGTILSSDASYSTPILNSNATYYVQAGIAGCMSARAAVTVSVNPIPTAPTVAGTSICAGNTASLNATAPGGSYEWYDAASGGNLLNTGSGYTTAILNSSTSYYAQTTINGCAGPRTAVTVTVNPVPAAPTAVSASVCNNTVATLSATTPGGSYQWFAFPSGGTAAGSGASFTTPLLTASTTYYVQTTVSGCTSARTAVPVTVTPLPAAPTALAPSICAGNSATVTATAPGGTYHWYDAFSGGNLLAIGSIYHSSVLSSSTTVWVQSTVSGCTGPRTAVAITVIPIPAAPSVPSTSICEGTTATLNATAPGGTYQWFDAATGGTLLGGGANYTSGILHSNTIFYVNTTIAGCTGSRTAVPVTVTPIPTVPAINGASICSGNTVDLSVVAQSGLVYNWYDASFNGTLLNTGNTYTTPTLNTNTTYYVQADMDGCTSTRSAVTVNVTPLPAAPTAAGNTICEGSAAVFNATAPGGFYRWYDAALNGNLLATATVYSTPTLSTTTTYYVEAVIAGCAGPRTAVTANVTATPAAPVIATTTICQDNTATLIASSPGGTYEWFDLPSSGALLNTGNSYTTAVLDTTTTYYVQSTIAGCTGPRAEVKVTVIQKLYPGFQYASGTFCISGSNPSPTIAGSLTGSFSASPAGLVFNNTATGEINVAASTPGNYTIMFTVSGACVYSTSSRITITTTPVAGFTYGSPVCTQTGFLQPAFTGTASAGVFSASNPGLVFTNASTGEIDLMQSTAGTYTVTNHIAASAGCAAATASGSITIHPAAIVRAGITQAICAGEKVQLNGSFAGAAANITWSGGLGSFDANTLPNAIYTPGTNETTAKLYITSNDPAGPCEAIKDSVMIYITPKPTSPVVAGASACIGAKATLVISAAGNYQWFDAATGGNLLATTNSYTTPSLNTATTYYVRSLNNGCTGDLVPVTVTVGPPPSVTSATGGVVCTGEQMAYSITADQAGASFFWTRDKESGISNSAVSGYTTGNLAEILHNTTGVPLLVTYSITATNGSCFGAPFTYTVTVNPAPPTPSVAASSPVCVGSTLSLSTPAYPGAVYAWTGPDHFSSSQQNPSLQNITTKSAGIYTLTLTVNSCSSQPSSINVFPVIAAPAASSNTPVCEGSAIKLSAGSLAGASYAWTGPNGFVSAQQHPGIASGSIQHSGYYYVTASIAGCPGLSDSVQVIVNRPPGSLQLSSNSPVCSQDTILLNASSAALGTNFKWSGPQGFSSSARDTLIANTSSQNSGTYTVIASAPGCATTTSGSLAVTVKSKPGKPAAASNSPVCEGATLNLFASSASGASYQWWNDAGYQAGISNPSRAAVAISDTGSYRVIASLNGCRSDTGLVHVAVVKASIAAAGNDQQVCANNAVIQLTGTISGEDTQTGIWSSSGTGRFSPSNTELRAQYIPSDADTAKQEIKLTLSTTNNTVCPVSASTTVLNISSTPFVYGGTDTLVCSNDSLISLQGATSHVGGAQWFTSGSGRFGRSGTTDLHPVYTPSVQDINKGQVMFYLATVNNTSCKTVYDTVYSVIHSAPRVSAGADQMLFLDDVYVFRPVITGNVKQFEWTPTIGLASSTVQNAVLTAKENNTYRLEVTDSSNCVSYDEVFVKVLKPVSIPNVFTPNADGVHDTWEIPELNNYPNATVRIFGRSGQQLYYSAGYGKPWDGTYNGQPVPVATYYYIIDTNFQGKRFSGSVTVIR